MRGQHGGKRDGAGRKSARPLFSDSEDKKKLKQAKLSASVAVQGPDVEQSAAPACDGDASTDPTAGTHAHGAPRSAAIVVESAAAAAPPSASGSRGGSSAGEVAAVPSSSARSIADELGQEAAAVFKIHYTRALLKSASEGLAKVVQQDLLMSSGRGEGAARAASR